MRSNPALTQPQIRKTARRGSAPPLAQALAALAGGVSLAIFFFMTLLIGYDMVYAGQIYPGVSVAGIPLAGMKPPEAALLLSQRLAFPQQGKIVLQDGERYWIIKPNELGLTLDAGNAALQAYHYGRQGGAFRRVADKLTAWYSGRDLPPPLIYDEAVAQKLLSAIAAEVDKPVIEAAIHLNGLEVLATPGQVGRAVDIPATLQALEGQVRKLADGIVPLVIVETQPLVLDASRQAETARQILSAPLVLQLPEQEEGDPGPWKIEPQQLAAMLSIERQQTPEGVQFRVGVSSDALRTYLTALGAPIERRPADARFIFNDQTRQLELIQPAVIGRSLDIEASLQAVQEKLAAGEHSASLVLTTAQPQVRDDVKAEELGITQLIIEETTYFYGSSASRIQNIQTAAGRFHGVLVPPGAVFSMADVLGDVSLDNGYAEALIIYGNRTIKGVGGGVCQVSTTLFRTVFFAGYPVVERHPHAYRVYYYELNAANQVDSRMAGLDATVYVPVVDFKFKNDSPHWLLMETYVNAAARTLTWKFYSTSDGRTVEWETTGLQNIVEPPEPLYQENPELPAGEIVQVDYEAQGADVSITRTVMLNGVVLYQDVFTTHYLPWRAVYDYGPGTVLPDKLIRR